MVPLTTAITTNKMAAAELLCDYGANPYLNGNGVPQCSVLVTHDNDSVCRALKFAYVTTFVQI